MRALGADLIEHGRDFDEARERALRLAAERNLEYAPAFHRNLVLEVATYAHELFTAVDDIDTVYVPIGLGSAICALIGTRDVLGRKTKVVGVVAAGANAYCRSLAAGRVVPTTSALTYGNSSVSAALFTHRFAPRRFRFSWGCSANSAFGLVRLQSAQSRVTRAQTSLIFSLMTMRS